LKPNARKDRVIPEGRLVLPRVSTTEFLALPLRAHAFLAGVPLHDV
jgi:hypothetical protein